MIAHLVFSAAFLVLAAGANVEVILEAGNVSGNVSFVEVNSTHTRVSFDLNNLQSRGHGLYIAAERAIDGCQGVTSVFDPEQVGECMSSSNCAVGNITGRQGDLLGLDNRTGQFLDSLIRLSGTTSVKGRTFVITNTSHVPWICAVIGDICPNGQYASIAMSETQAATCTTFDEQAGHTVHMGIYGYNASTFADIGNTFVTNLTAVTANSRLHIVRLETLTPDTVLVVIAGSTRATDELIPQSSLLADLQQEWQDTGCLSEQELACRCSSTCSMIASLSRCPVTGGSNCSVAVNATTLDPINYPADSEVFVRTCPLFPTTCLSKQTGFAITSLELGPTAPVEDDDDDDSDADDDQPPEIDSTPWSFFNSSFGQITTEGLVSLSGLWFSMVQSKGLPFEDIVYHVQYMEEQGDFDKSRLQSDAIDYLLPVAIMVAILLLSAIFTPFVACCICCCRTCHCCCCWRCCGGQLTHKNESVTCRRILLVVFFLSTILFVLCIVGLLSADHSIHTGISAIESSVSGGVDALETFAHTTIDQAEIIARDLFEYMTGKALQVLDSVSADLVTTVQDAIDDSLSVLLPSLDDLSSRFSDLLVSLSGITAALNTTQMTATLLNGSLSNAASELQLAIADCNALAANLTGYEQTALQSICNSMAAVDLGAITLPPLPTFADELDTLTDIEVTNLTSLAAEAQQVFDDLVDIVKNETSSIKQTVHDELDNFEEQMNETILDIRSQADDIIQDNLRNGSTAVLQEVEEYTDLATEYDTYRQYFTFVTASLYGLAVVVAWYSIYCGMYGYDPKLTPTERTSTSDHAGKCLIFLAVLLTVVGCLLNIFLWVLYTTSTVTDKTCVAFQSDAIIGEVIDNPTIWPDEELPLSGLIAGENETAVQILVMDVLDACRSNEALWVALSMDYRYNITEELDILQSLNIDESLDQLSLPNISIFTNDVFDSIDSFLEINATAEESFTQALDALNSNLTSADLNSTKDMIESLTSSLVELQANMTSPPSSLEALINRTEGVADAVEGVEAGVASLEASFSGIEASIEDTRSALTNISIQADVFYEDAFAVEQTFRTTLEDVLDVQGVQDFVTEAIENFTSLATKAITEDIARCRTLTDVYDGVIDSVCDNFFNSIDAWMMSFALLCLMSVVLICLSLKLARYFRRMEDDYTPKKSQVKLDMLPMHEMTELERQNSGYELHSEKDATAEVRRRRASEPLPPLPDEANAAVSSFPSSAGGQQQLQYDEEQVQALPQARPKSNHLFAIDDTMAMSPDTTVNPLCDTQYEGPQLVTEPNARISHSDPPPYEAPYIGQTGEIQQSL